MSNFLINVARWILIWALYVAAVCSVGAVAGLVTHVVYGAFFTEAADLSFYASLGLRNGLKYGAVWAGGAALVLCVMRARREYLAKHGDSEQGEAL